MYKNCFVPKNVFIHIPIVSIWVNVLKIKIPLHKPNILNTVLDVFEFE